MDERGIIIADRDAEYRKEMAEFFQKAGYSVETTDSAVHVLCSILQKQSPVLLLGDDFDKKLSSADLIHLLKKCNRRLHVIMVSDEMPLAQLRQVRQEGIFYHALKPSNPGDTEEIGTAVESAFQAGSTTGNKRQEISPAADESTPSADRAVPVHTVARTLSWIIPLALLIFGSLYLSLVSAERAAGGNSAPVWFFIGFCALIVTTQLFPVFRIKLSATRSVDETAQQHEDGSPED